MSVEDLVDETRDAETGARSWWWWCPGCDSPHRVDETWRLSGPKTAPTISPSVLCRTGPSDVCHCYVRSGSIEFLGDSTHELAGRTVAMVPWSWSSGP